MAAEWLLTREVAAPAVLGGVRIPAGATVVFSPWSEMVIILAEIAKHWDLAAVPGTVPRVVPRVTVHPDRIVLTPRRPGTTTETR